MMRSSLLRAAATAAAASPSFTFTVPSFPPNEGGLTIPSSVTLPKETAIKMFSDMHLVRGMELRCTALYANKQVRGFLHSQFGEEAVPIGAVHAMKAGDKYSGSYRIHGWYYALTGNIEGAIGEILGRSCGCSKGKGGSMHLYAPDKGLYGGQGIVGAQVPLAMGLALAAKYNHSTPQYATVALFGDGALNNGQVLEVCNIAALWRLPVIICMEDNLYSMGTASSRGSFEQSLRKRVPYIPGIDFDGMDIIATYAAFQAARQHVMSGNGPILLHCHTYRFANHSVSDAGKYRTQKEVQDMQKMRDPIHLFQKALLNIDPQLSTTLQDAEGAALDVIDNAANKVVSTPLPPMSELTADVYAGERVPVRSCQTVKYI